MKKLFLFTVLACALSGNSIFAQSSETIKNYIEAYQEIAIEEMIRTGVPASITLAQGIHETAAGTSVLVRKSNNHFGIKCKSEWKGESVSHDDDAPGECFRKYDSPLDSYRDHSDFLKYRPYYTSLFDLDPTDYKGWATGLKKAGYATNPKYAQVLIKLIEDYDLQQYTLIALDRKNGVKKEVIWASQDNNETLSEPEVDFTVDESAYVHPEYPSGIFKINETSVVFIKKGTAFLKIAKDYGMSLSRLFEFNDMEPADIASRDQLFYVQRKRKTGASDFHTVQQGESLYIIAQLEGIRLQELLNFNLLHRGMQPAPGEKLYLKYKAAKMPRLVSDRVAPREEMKKENIEDGLEELIIHVVQPKETVYGISKKYDVSMDDVIKWNDLENSDLKAGQEIRINKKR